MFIIPSHVINFNSRLKMIFADALKDCDGSKQSEFLKESDLFHESDDGTDIVENSVVQHLDAARNDEDIGKSLLFYYFIKIQKLLNFYCIFNL